MDRYIDRIRRALADRYEIIREVGRGGMATVFLANDVRHGRRVAVKVFRSDLSQVLGFGRFEREIKIIAQLHHPHILPLYDSGEADGFLYYVMPYEEGPSLRERMRTGGPLPVHEAVRLLRDVADALTYAHEKGVVHRDIKPDNVLLSGRHALVTDFGVAKAVSEASGKPEITTAGLAIGTPTYMAPEQAVADPNVDHRADIYAVGALGYEMLAGKPPFTGSPHAILAAHVTETPKPVSDLVEDIPPALNAVIMRCLEKTPDDRWRTMDALLSALEPLATPSSGTAAVQPFVRRSGVSVWAAGATALIVLMAIVLVTVLGSSSPPVFEIERTTQLTRAPGLEIDPAISPDGRMVAFVTGPIGQTRVQVRQVAGGRAFELGENLEGAHRRPEWSPDGSEVAFQADDAIYVIPALGGVQRLMVEPMGDEAVHSHVWSPDGDQIAFVEDSTIYVQCVVDGSRRVVTNAIEPHSLAWSRNGAHIAYVSGNRNFVYGEVNFANIAPTSLWVVNVEDGQPTRVTDNTSLDVSPIWAPGDDRLFFVSGRGGSRDVYDVSISGRGAVQGDPRRLTTGINAHTISVSDDGNRLAYSVFTHYANVWSAPLRVKNAPVSVTEAISLTVGNQTIEAIAVSPDRQWLAYDSDISGNQDIYKRPLEGGESQQLTSDPHDDFLPEWSPDGSQIAFYSFRNGNRDIYVMSADGGPARQITDHPRHERSPNWSPDSERLVFYSDRTGRYEIWVISIDEPGDWRQVTFDGGISGRWSPDGRWIAYIEVGPPRRVRIVSPDGGEPVTLCAPGGVTMVSGWLGGSVQGV